MFHQNFAFAIASTVAAAAFRAARAAARARTPEARGWAGLMADKVISQTGGTDRH